MGDGMNKVVLLGNLGAEPELKYTHNGTPILTFRLATNESFLDRNRELTERTEWHNVVIFGARAEALSRHLRKGICVAVEGSIRTSSYEKDGQKRYKTDVHARELCFTGGPAQSRSEPMPLGRDMDDDIPPLPIEMPMPSSEEPPGPEERPRPEDRPPTGRLVRKKNGTNTRKPEAMMEEMPF